MMEPDTQLKEQVFTGMKVLDLTHWIAGPFCTKLLADYGAEVIKVERPGRGDGSRHVGPFPGDIPDTEKSGLFLYLNTNKKSITLNLKTGAGKEVLEELVRRSDILVENFSPRVMPALGLSYQELRTIKPGLVMTSISNFGSTGPYRDWKATEITLYAMCGQMYKRGEPDREPLKHALNVFQYFAGTIASTVTIAAAMRSARTGSGEHIDQSIWEPMVGDADNRVFNYDYTGEIGARTTAKNYSVYPYGGFAAKDGYVAIQGAGREDWMPRLYNMIGRPEFKDDPRFCIPENRARNSEEFNVAIYSWLVDHTKEEIFDEAAKARYPVAPVYNTQELVNNPHYRGREYFVNVEHPKAGMLTYPGAPAKMSHSGYSIRKPAPLLGEHNKEVYCGLLGYSDHDFTVLARGGAI